MSCDYAESYRQLPVPNVPAELSHNAQAAGCKYVCAILVSVSNASLCISEAQQLT